MQSIRHERRSAVKAAASCPGRDHRGKHRASDMQTPFMKSARESAVDLNHIRNPSDALRDVAPRRIADAALL